MNPLTLMMIASLLLLVRGSLYRLELDIVRLAPVRFILAGMKGLKSVGGIWFAIVGAPLAAWFLTTFFILPLLGISGYTLNIQTVLALANPTAVLIFLALWLGIAFGFIGGTAAYKRNGGKK